MHKSLFFIINISIVATKNIIVDIDFLTKNIQLDAIIFTYITTSCFLICGYYDYYDQCDDTYETVFLDEIHFANETLMFRNKNLRYNGEFNEYSFEENFNSNKCEEYKLSEYINLQRIKLNYNTNSKNIEITDDDDQIQKCEYDNMICRLNSGNYAVWNKMQSIEHLKKC